MNEILTQLATLEAELKALHAEGDLTSGPVAERADRLINDIEAAELKLKSAKLAETQARVSRLIQDNPLQAVSLAPELAPQVKAKAHADSAEFKAFLLGQSGRAESKALTLGTDATGGALSATAAFVNELFTIAARESIARRLCRVITVQGARAAEVPVLITDRADAAWVAESTTQAHAGMTFARRTISLFAARARTGITRQLLVGDGVGVEGIVAQQLALSVGYLTDGFVMSGTGTGQPLGVVPENAAGVPAGQTQAAVSNAAINHDNIVDVFHRLRPPYQNRATWLISNSAMAAIRRLKDTTGQPLLQAGVIEAGVPSLLGRPVFVSEFLPAIGANNTTMLVGDWNQYAIAQAGEIDLLVDPFSAAHLAEIHYYAFQMLGGWPLVGEAFARLRHPV